MRGFPHSRNPNLRSKFVLLNKKKPSSSSSLYISILSVFGFSIIIIFFIFLSNKSIILLEEDDDPNDPKLVISDHSQTPNIKLPDPQLWGAHNFGFQSCIRPTPKYTGAQETDRYITVRSNGGLNQMRTGICDMVAVARILNATLVIPQLDRKSFWKDSSLFSDIFDEQHFITALQEDVRIIKELPKELESVPRARKHFTSWASMGYYEEMKHLWKEYQVIHVAKSDSRLANNDLPLDIQRLRCRALYHALQFSPPISRLGKVLSIHDGYNRSWWNA